MLPNATALALADHAEVAGTASALLGVVQFLIGALVAPLVGAAGRTARCRWRVVMTAWRGRRWWSSLAGGALEVAR